jgi:hypothetical protein
MTEIERIIWSRISWIDDGSDRYFRLDCNLDDLAKAIEQYVIKARTTGAIMGQGWTHADNCCDLDKGKDPRKKIIPEMMDRMLGDLSAELKKGIDG